MYRRLLWVVWCDENSVAGCKTRRVRYIAPSYGGSIRGRDGIAHHVPARSPLNLRPSGPAVHAQMRPPWAAHGHVATLSDATRILQTRTNRRYGANRGTQTASPAWNLQASTPPSHSADPRQPPRCEEHGPIEAAGLGIRHSSTVSGHDAHTVAAGTQDQ